MISKEDFMGLINFDGVNVNNYESVKKFISDGATKQKKLLTYKFESNDNDLKTAVTTLFKKSSTEEDMVTSLNSLHSVLTEKYGHDDKFYKLYEMSQTVLTKSLNKALQKFGDILEQLYNIYFPMPNLSTMTKTSLLKTFAQRNRNADTSLPPAKYNAMTAYLYPLDQVHPKLGEWTDDLLSYMTGELRKHSLGPDTEDTLQNMHTLGTNIANASKHSTHKFFTFAHKIAEQSKQTLDALK